MKYQITTKENAKNDILSGLTVALALVPEAVAFAFVADIPPIVGLYGAFMMGLITAVFGGRPGMISGATGAIAVVIISLIVEGNKVGAGVGLQYLFLALLLMGMIQIAAGFLRLGKFVRLIPHPVMLGFVNGLAIVIFASQLGMFKEKVMIDGESMMQWMHGSSLYLMIGLVALTMAIMVFLPKITKKIPAALTAIIVVSAIVIGMNLDVSTVGSFIKDGGGTGLKGGLPQFDTSMLSLLNWDTFKLILPYAFIMAAVGLIESLMTLNLIDEMTGTRGSGNKECVAQGTANIVNGFFGGMGGCAMIGQSLINVNSGGKGRLSGIVASLTLLSFVLFASPLIEQVPIAALVGVMFMVVVGTFEWASLGILHKIPLSDALVIVIVSAITYFEDLAVAVLVGVIVSALVFAWENATRIRARKHYREDGTRVYEIWGPLFFGSTMAFISKFDVKNDPKKVEIDFIESRVSDHSGVEAISNIIEKYEAAGKEIKLLHLSADCKRILRKASLHFDELIEEDVNDPRYYVVANVNEVIK